ncbi:SDR family NAD(P)-dependent oxidoreductase [Roseovarius sp. 2305UL8-3]|uniref:SDR family NAD(P)-dependent oxidoreductase n=1 Tax=Roseovarius conchicola TaxID=3121636 RepID=UPI003529BD54
MDLKGKVALITGASAPRGIGRAIALRLAQEGAAVAVADIAGSFRIDDKDHDRQALLQELVETITDVGGTAMALSMDVSKADAIADCVARITTELGLIDILVNNAGSLAGSDAFMSTTPEQWEASFRVNLLGPMMLSQAVIPGMQAKGGGRIINIGSTGSLGAEAGFGAYTTMKHGLVGLSKTIAAEFGPDGIRCNTVCPGYIMTDMHMAANARLAAKNDVSIPEMQAHRYAHVALRDAGQPDDVAEAVAYLAGPAGAYVTGINLPVTGGVRYGI